MGDKLDEFIRERKSRVAEDKARLQRDPPYMDMETKHHRAYESAVKENIPPNGVTEGKEESCSVGLQLGVEYERKKQRLQHELRMDYRLYLAQKKHFDPAEPAPLLDLDNRRPVRQHLTDSTDGLPKHRAPSRRDAATLTEDSKGPRRALHLDEEDEERTPPVLRQCDRLRKPVEPGSEEDEDVKEELDGMEVRRCRITKAEVNHEKRCINKIDGREKKDNLLSLAIDNRRWRVLTKQEDAEFATGLVIGAADTVEAVQRKKERYRKELEEQIAEQHRNKKREKDLELKVAATGANDPEKQPDRIRQFGLSRRKYLQVSEPSVTAESESSSSRGFHSHRKMMVRGRDTPPPDQPHVAFQSPLLAHSSALGLSPSSQPAMDTPRIPVFPPYPPSTLSEAYRNLYAEPHYCYTNRNLLEPNMAYNDHLSVPDALFLPSSHWNMPPGAAVPSQFGIPSPHSQHSGSSFPEPQILPSSAAAAAAAAAALDSHIRVFPAEKSRSNRERILSYRDALKEQIQEQQERRRLEMQERERLEAELEADMRNHQPWGRGGGGAPLRDGTGNLIADLNRMHKLNEEAYANPEQWQRRAMATVTVPRQADDSPPDPSERVSGFTHVHTPQFARGKVFANQPTQHKLQEQDKYKAYLKQQIEEKMHKKAEEREKIRLEEEREEKRLAEQRARIQSEYEEEQEKKRRKEMEQKAKNEELVQLAEQRKKEAERKKKEEEENAKLRRQCEQERRVLVEVHREPSPPIPTQQKRHGPHRYTPRPPSADSQRSVAPLSERSLSGLQSPPVPACRNQLRAAGDRRGVVSELSALRRQLHCERKRLEGRLQMDDWEELDSLAGDRLQERPLVDVFDMARLRLQAPVRRPSSRNREPRNLLRIQDSLQLKYPDGKSSLGTSEVSQQDDVSVSSRRRHEHRVPFQLLGSQRSTAQDDYLDLPPQHQRDYQRSAIVRSARGSLLESDSAFINPLGDALPSPQFPELQKIQRLSARERRRLTKQPQHPQKPATSSQREHDTHTHTWLQEDQDHSSEGRSGTAHLMAAPSHHGPVGLSDDDWSPQFSPDNLNHQSSTESVATDLWMRLHTPDTLKCSERPSRTDHFAT